MITTIIAFGKIIFVDLIMSGDNAIIIALATKNLNKEIRNKAIYIGIAGAAILRIFLASIALYLLQYPSIQYIGGILLLYIARSFFKTLKLGNEQQHLETTAATGLWGAIGIIIMADFSLSLDNVLAVASIAENIWLLAIGLVASVAMMMFASKAITKLMEQYAWIQWGGLLVILHTAVNILMTADVTVDFLSIPIRVWGLLVMVASITYLYIQEVVHVAFHLRKHHLHNHVRLGIIAISFIILLLSDFIPALHTLIHTYYIERITLLVVTYMMLLELIMQQYSIDKHYHLKNLKRH